MRFLAVFFAISLGFSSQALAIDDAPPTEGQQIIRSQIEAFGRDDADAAYALAAPAIKAIFPDAKGFLSMVKHGYAPVYRHRSVDFGESRAAANSIAQKVTFVDADGVPWDALYTLERQSDGTWKISGCVLMKSKDQAA